MPDTYTANEDGSYTVVNAGETQFINFTAFNPETGYKWSSMQEVKTFGWPIRMFGHFILVCLRKKNGMQ